MAATVSTSLPLHRVPQTADPVPPPLARLVKTPPQLLRTVRVDPMLTVEQINAHLAHVTYRPGWTFRAYQGRWAPDYIVIRTVVLDAYNPDQTTTLDIRSRLPPMRDDLAVDEWLTDRLREIEVHEMREWFRVDGVPIYDPHREDEQTQRDER